MNDMNRAAWRLVLLLTAMLSLTACVSAPPRQTFNREAYGDVKSIVVLPMRDSKPGVMMMNHPGAQFGLIGALVAAANMAGKDDKLTDQLSKAGFDENQILRQALGSALERRGYAVSWPADLVDKAANKTARENTGLRKSYSPNSEGQAQLDINFGFLGYAAAGASDKQPYRPTVMITTRLVGADGKTFLFRDSFAYHNVFNQNYAIVVEPDPQYSYPDFDDLDAADDASAQGLKLAIEALADKIAAQL